MRRKYWDCPWTLDNIQQQGFKAHEQHPSLQRPLSLSFVSQSQNRSFQVASGIFKAMATGDITISHPGFQVQAQQTVRSLWTDEDFADVTLASADDKQMRAHKAILSSCSPFFRNILLKNPHQSPLLYLGNLHSSQLQQVSTSVNLVDDRPAHLKFRFCGSSTTASAIFPRTNSHSFLRLASSSGSL